MKIVGSRKPVSDKCLLTKFVEDSPSCQDDPEGRAEKLFAACDVNNDGFLTKC